jgi:hypothetical protein
MEFCIRYLHITLFSSTYFLKIGTHKITLMHVPYNHMMQAQNVLVLCVLHTLLNTPNGILFVKTVINGTVHLVIPYSVVADSEQWHLLNIMVFQGTQHSKN